MTTNQLLHADLLDIIFEHRNKEYGAYVLRREYPRNLTIAMFSMLGLVTVFVIYSLIKPGKVVRLAERIKGGHIVELIQLPPEEPKPQEQQIIKDKPPTKIDKVPVIVDKDSIKHPVPPRDTPDEYVPGNEDSPGKGNGNNMVQPQDGGNNNGNTFQPAEPETPRIIEQGEADEMPEFPGGPEALRRFLGNLLRMPEELEEGDKRTVKVKFVVNVNGEITDVAIVQSAGATFDREVLKVIAKMPKWKPGKQRGKNVAVYFTQPVSFVSVSY